MLRYRDGFKLNNFVPVHNYSSISIFLGKFDINIDILLSQIEAKVRRNETN